MIDDLSIDVIIESLRHRFITRRACHAMSTGSSVGAIICDLVVSPGCDHPRGLRRRGTERPATASETLSGALKYSSLVSPRRGPALGRVNAKKAGSSNQVDAGVLRRQHRHP